MKYLRRISNMLTTDYSKTRLDRRTVKSRLCFLHLMSKIVRRLAKRAILSIFRLHAVPSFFNNNVIFCALIVTKRLRRPLLPERWTQRKAWILPFTTFQWLGPRRKWGKRKRRRKQLPYRIRERCAKSPTRLWSQILYIKQDVLHAFKNFPFQGQEDEEMCAMVSSVKDKGAT